MVGGEPVGHDADADVLWLQAGEWYADLRIPHRDDGGAVEAFAGPARWEPPRFTWVHDLDWLGTFPSDEGTFESDGDALVERGTFVDGGRTVPYLERWERASPHTDFVVARGARASGGRAVLVEVGADRLVLVDERERGGGFAVRREDRRSGEWTTRFARGADLAPLDVRVGRPSVAVGDAITFGAWTLTVTDVGDGAAEPVPPI